MWQAWVAHIWLLRTGSPTEEFRQGLLSRQPSTSFYLAQSRELVSEGCVPF